MAIDTSIVSWYNREWDGEDCVGTNDLTLVWTPTFSSTGWFIGQYITHASNKYAQLATNNLNFWRTQARSYSVWFWTSNTTWDNFFISSEWPSLPYRWLHFRTDSTWKIVFDFLKHYANYRYILTSTESYAWSQRNHLVFRYNGSWPSTSNMTAKLNNVPLTLNVTLNTIWANDWSWQWWLRFGWRLYDATQFFNGRKDLEWFFNEYISDADITTLYNWWAGKAPPFASPNNWAGFLMMM